MAGEAVAAAPSRGPIPRPALLKGLHHATVKRNLYASIASCIVATILYKVAINDPKKRTYAEFYKTYDADASFERMRKAGLLQSAPADN